MQATRHDNDNCDVTIQAVGMWNQRVWMWHTSYESATPAFHKYVEVVIGRLVQ